MKPTPLQARTLRLLATDDKAEVRLYSRGQVSVCRDDGWRSGETQEERQARRDAEDRFTAVHLAAEIKRLRRASVDAMIRAGWLEAKEDHALRLTDMGAEIVQLLSPEDFEDRPRPTEPLLPIELIRGALKDRWHGLMGWVWFFEFSPGINGRRLDALAVNRWGGKYAYQRMAFEVKRSRSDFLGELRDPAKRLQGGQVADRFWYVTPAGLVEASEIPGDCGLVWVDEDGRARIKRKAPGRSEKAPTSRAFVGALLTYIVDRPRQQEWRKAMKDL